MVFGNLTQGLANWQQPPDQLSQSETSAAVVGATDGNANAIAAYLGAGSLMKATYFKNGSWAPLQSFGPGGYPSIAMDASATGLIVYSDFSTNSIRTAFFNGNTWVIPSPSPLYTYLNFSSNNRVGMDGNGNGIAIWDDYGTSSIWSSFFSGGNWSPPVNIGNGRQAISVAYSSNGDAAAIWQDSGFIKANNYVNGSWQGEVILGNQISFKFSNVVIDSSGNAFAAWTNPAGDIVVSQFNRTSWLTPETISTTPTLIPGASLAMNPSGKAVLIWTDSLYNGLSSVYDGTSWGPVKQFGSNLVTVFSFFGGYNLANVSIDHAGNALVVFGTYDPVLFTNKVLSAKLPNNGTWLDPLLVQDIKDPVYHVDLDNTSPLTSAISSNGKGFAFWTEIILELEKPLVYASFLDSSPTSPRKICGDIVENRFASQKNRIHVIEWIGSADVGVVSYHVRRNGKLIATIAASSNPLVYVDYNRCAKHADTYAVTAVNAEGYESQPLTISLK